MEAKVVPLRKLDLPRKRYGELVTMVKEIAKEDGVIVCPITETERINIYRAMRVAGIRIATAYDATKAGGTLTIWRVDDEVAS